MSRNEPGPSPLRQLVNIISQSVDKIEGTYKTAGLQYPDLNAPFNPDSPAEALSMSPEVIQAASLAVAACAQLSATIKVPALTLYDSTFAFYISAALGTSQAANVVEILRGQEQGLHVSDIAAQSGLDANKLSRILRLLATHHVFAESSPDVFKNNRLSSMLDTLKSVEEIKANPDEKHVNTPGMGALVEHSCDEVLRGASYLTEVLMDPVMGHSEDPKYIPMSYAYKWSGHPFEWYEQPGNEGRHKRLVSAMAGTARVDPPNAILSGFKWSDLPTGSVIVDIGGGMGHNTLKIREANPHLSYIVQDRPSVIEKAQGFWETNLPVALADGTVHLQGHDFFKPQPVRNATVFHLRMIMHDYPTQKAMTILRHLREAATPNTKLLLIDSVVPYSCLNNGSTTKLHSDIVGADQLQPPEPLLANLGKANSVPYLADFQMLVSLGGEERTLKSFIDLTKGTGWKIVQIFPIPGSLHSQTLAVPC